MPCLPVHLCAHAVLDDNCTLCLPNGERIKLNPLTMRMVSVCVLCSVTPADG